MAPFSGDALVEIKSRSHGRSELSNRTDRPLHCLHKNHDKSNPLYNDPNNGLRGTITEHLAQHIYYRDQSVAGIGLAPCRNDWAIDKLNQEVVTFLYKIGKLEQLPKELEVSMILWDTYARENGLLIIPNYATLLTGSLI